MRPRPAPGRRMRRAAGDDGLLAQARGKGARRHRRARVQCGGVGGHRGSGRCVWAARRGQPARRAGPQNVGVERLGQHIVGAGLPGQPRARGVGFLRDHDDRRVGRGRVGAQRAAHGHAVHAGQTQVQQDQVGLEIAGPGHGGVAVEGKLALAEVLDEVAQQLHGDGVVVDHQHAWRSRGLARRRTAQRGRVPQQPQQPHPQGGGVEGLAQVVDGPCRQRLGLERGRLKLRQHDHRQVGGEGVAPQCPAHGQAGQIREVGIQQHRVGPLLAGQAQRLFAGGGKADSGQARKRPPDDLDRHDVVVDHQHLQTGGGGADGGRRRRLRRAGGQGRDRGGRRGSQRRNGAAGARLAA